MSHDSKKLLWRIKQKARKLKRALVRELNEEVELGQCMEWVCTTYGFRSSDELNELHQPESFAFDEFISKAGQWRRLSNQADSLAFDFDLDDATAQRLVEEVRPTAFGLQMRTIARIEAERSTREAGRLQDLGLADAKTSKRLE